ncbi:MAG: hypothetical protein GTO51_08820 [Candidatus Latescibacteria bacterium]|nr:hypothetical protein [Candidatus Latescibacterota bacterium]NIM22054.1 hypothetical protein [Candidatus Latescibacterota bacterium]NIM66073.1 hypothetical protein [Candidatus Latescibacterota bacterium]NIO02481.1 hypothetical protein [Candidatus Latescibacterota bacterium]NIO29392.1 hypothetical protein [Candidatus Latescibacterota bacterium]
MKIKQHQDSLNWWRYICSAVVIASLIAPSLGIVGCGGDDSPSEPPEVNPPVIQSVSKAVVSPGDTITINGQQFATPASQNRVTFNNPLAVVIPFFASTTSMSAVVPEDAATGPMTVTSKGVKSDPTTVEVTRGIGDVWVIAGASMPYSFKLPDPTGTARYLIVPHSATTVPLTFWYSVSPGTTSVYPSPPAMRKSDRRGTQTFEQRFERSIQEQAIEYIERYGAGKRPTFKRAPTQGPPPDTTTFYVLNTTTGSTVDPSSFTLVTAALRYNGSHGLIYSDIDEPSGGYSQADYDEMGQQFDNEIYPMDSTYFGPETDIDGSDRVVILFSRIINELTPDGQAGSGFIAGFFLLNDLAPGIVPPGTGNGMEIFYVLVPDPTGETGNVFPKASVKPIAVQTLAHEFEHMISFGYRFVILGGGTSITYTQALWLEEGMAHIAEDLNAMNSSNIGRANLFLADPGAVSLMGDDTLEQRGAIYLFLRYLGDQLGNSIYRTILRSSCIGMACIENVTGENFFLSTADYFAALYLSNSGVPHDGKYDYTSINYPGDFNPLAVTSRSVSQGQFNGSVRNAAADFYTVGNISTPALRLTVTGGTGAAIRVVITRIQ